MGCFATIPDQDQVHQQDPLLQTSVNPQTPKPLNHQTTMASGLIFNPIHLLHAAPLATSTATLAHALLELITDAAFLQPQIRQQSETVLPTWYNQVFGRAVWTVVTLNLSTISAAAATLVLNRQRHDLQTPVFYWVGMAGAIGHLMFVPFVAGPVQRIIEAKGKKSQSTRDMERWLSVHRVRMLVADLPAWIAFVGAVLTL